MRWLWLYQKLFRIALVVKRYCPFLIPVSPCLPSPSRPSPSSHHQFSHHQPLIRLFAQSIFGQAVLPFRHHSEPPYPAHKAHIALFVRPRHCPQGHFSVPTSDFLQIPPRGGHPCLWPTVPTAKSVADFHRQVIAHGERTKRKASKT